MITMRREREKMYIVQGHQQGGTVLMLIRTMVMMMRMMSMMMMMSSTESSDMGFLDSRQGKAKAARYLTFSRQGNITKYLKYRVKYYQIFYKTVFKNIFKCFERKKNTSSFV